jgi:crotonobetainyl-CoA:carnitine CoA-transferase CaiB-like acyl-CoA transferase
MPSALRSWHTNDWRTGVTTHPPHQAPPALDGVLIVDATEGVGGPYAAMLLADQGAEVIKVEPPGGDRLRGAPAFHVLNRGKRSVVLAPDAEDDRIALRRLLSTADVFLHDWSPGRDQALGLDRESLRGLNPRLVTGYLPAYGSRGPYANLPPNEGLIQAVSGVCHAQWRYDERPVFLNIPISGYAQGIIGAAAVAATLYARSRGGRGDWFELSGVAALFAMETAAYLRGPDILRMAGRADPRSPFPTYRLVRGADDWLFAGALTPAFWASMAVALGLEDCLVDPRFDGAPLAVADLEARKELAARVDAAFVRRPRDEWLRILEEADVPRAPVLAREEFAEDPQVAHNHMLIEVVDPEVGPTRQMGIPVVLHDTPGRVRGPAPRLNEYAEAMRAPRPQPRADAPSVLEPRQAPLDGVVVLDLSGFIAGANCPMLLADMGATVIKVEGPEGDGWRTSGLAFLGANRGKRGLCLDLKRPEGRELFLRLVERADVVVDNYRAGVLERLGLEWDSLRRRNPRLIHCSVTGYGPTGPYAPLPGFDPLMQARSGLMRAQGEPGGEPVYLQIPVCDFSTALMAAFGVVTALAARERTGRGNRVETCLLNNAFSVQAGEFISYAGRPADPPGGRDLAGRHAFYRIYGTSDGWLFLACSQPDHATAFAEVTGGPLVVDGDAMRQPLDGRVAAAIAGRLERGATTHWIETLTDAGVPCAPCTRVEDLFEDAHTTANDLWWDIVHPQWGQIRQTGAAVHWHEMKMRLAQRAPLLGEHSTEVLREFGVDQSYIAELLAKGVVLQAQEQGQRSIR